MTIANFWSRLTVRRQIRDAAATTTPPHHSRAKGWVRAIVAGSVVTLAIAGTPAFAQPALWAIKDADSTIYALGTVHLLKPDTEWKSPAIAKAIDEATELWLELPTTDSEALAGEMMPLVSKYGLSPAQPLSADLTTEEIATFDDAVRSTGLSAAQLDIARPWFAAITISSATITAAGYEPASGVDRKIELAFAERGIHPRGLESMEQQIRVFADMERDDELAFLRQTIADYRRAGAMMDSIVAEWAVGDIAGLEAILVDEMRSGSEDLYQALLVKRNADWADQITQLLAGSGVSFIAVGSAHLIGDDSLLAMLASEGVTIERIQ